MYYIGVNSAWKRLKVNELNVIDGFLRFRLVKFAWIDVVQLVVFTVNNVNVEKTTALNFDRKEMFVWQDRDENQRFSKSPGRGLPD